MAQDEKKQQRVQELDAAQGKLANLIQTLKENPSLTDEEIAGLEGGTASGTVNNSSCPTTNYIC
jgi:hypothetical protein